MEETHWDVLVIGAGPAGLSAALLLGRARRRTLVIDARRPRNRFASHMHGVLGNEGSSPRELREKGQSELASYGVEIVEGTVDRVDGVAEGVRVTLDDGTVVTSRAAIVATGIADVLPSVPGLAERWGRSVLHCPYCHGWEVRDTKLGVLATTVAGLHQAFLVRQWSDDVTVFTAELGEVPEEASARLRSRGVKCVASPVVEIMGEAGELSAVRTADNEVTQIDAIFTAGTPQPHDAFLDHLELERAEIVGASFLVVDAEGKTSRDRIWAVGNLVNPMLTVPMSIGAGAITGAAVNRTLVLDDFDDAERALTPVAFWENRYSGGAHVWSGQANAVLADVIPNLEIMPRNGGNGPDPSQQTAIDLGCGEGADALWLAQRGWRTTGVDISRNAIERAQVAATTAGIAGADVRFIIADLANFESTETFDLVTASFLQSPVELARAELLGKAARMVAPGGHLLVTAHAAPPRPAEGLLGPGHDSAHADFPTPDEDLALLALDPGEWTVVLKELRPRTVTRPNEDPFVTEDSVVLAQRA